MSSEGKRKVILVLCTVSFTLGILRTCGSTKAAKWSISDGFETYRRTGSNKTAMEREVRFGSLGPNFQTKYRSYGGINVDGLRGNSLAPQTSLLNITNSKLLKARHNSNQINERSESSTLATESPHSQKNDGVNGGGSLLKSDTNNLTQSGEKYLNLSGNSKWSDDTGAEKSHMESLNNDSGYQSDATGEAALMGNLLVSADDRGLPPVNILQAAESKPLVLCGTESMTLVANANEYDHLKVHGANDAPLYLSELPSSCGHTLKTTPRNMVLKTSYDGCFITKKGDKYIMPLLWWESPVDISCPGTVTQTPFPPLPPPPPPPLPLPPIHPFHPPVICTPFGMNLNIEGGVNTAVGLTVDLSGKRVPFLLSQCGYHVTGPPEQPIVHVPYGACGMKMMAGMQVLSLFSGKTEKNFICPLYLSSSPFLHSVLPSYGYFSSSAALPIPPLEVPAHPPVTDPLYSYQTGPAPPDKHPHLLPGYHPYSYVNPSIHTHASASGTSPPSFVPPVDSGLHMPQMGFPVCTPSGPLPCISLFPFHDHRDPLSVLHDQPHDPLSRPPHRPRDLPPSLPHHHRDPFSSPHDSFSLPPHHHHDPFSSSHDSFALPPDLHHDPPTPTHHLYDILSPTHHHHDPLSPLPHHHHDPLSPLPHHHHDPFSPPTHHHHDLLSPTHPHHDPLSPPLHHHHDPFSHPPHHHYDLLSPPHHHHDPLSPPPHHHHDPFSPPPHHHHDPFSPPTHHHHDPFSPPPHHHHDPFNFLSLPPSPTLSSPFLSCNTSHMRVTLSSAVPGTIQIKGQDNEWRPISSVPGCSFNLKAMGVFGVIVSSSLHPCNAFTVSPTKLTLPIKFADAVLGKDRILQLQCPYRSSTTSLVTPPAPTPQFRVSCSDHSMSVELPPSYQYALLVQGTELGRSDAHRHCGHSVTKGENGRIVLNVPFTSCYMSEQDNKRTIFLKFLTLSGQEGEVPLSCAVTPPIKKQGCEISHDLRLPCGHSLVSAAECQSLGCCYSAGIPACYYPLDECTADRHMVFTVPASLTDPPLSTSSLFTPGNNTCFPIKFTPSLALFKIPLDGCGVHKYEVGHTKIYMVEILNTLYAISLNYGTITRDSPVRLIVECRHSPTAHVSVGYLVKTPSLGPSIQAPGVFGVQLRIAKDENYTDYYPQYHRPFSSLLKQPLYLEVRLLNPPDDDVVLLVHYCLAYPRSARAAWVLNYDGCPNKLDTTGNSPASTQSKLGQTRQFTIRTFQFLSPDLSYTDEEIYFMCSTEICSPADGLCVEGCLQGPSPDN